MSLDERELLVLLADGKPHSGEDMARQLGVTRAAIWKQLQRLRQQGTGIEAVRGRGYQLPGGMEFLDANEIGKQLVCPAACRPQFLEVHYRLPSTNQVLLERLASGPIHRQVIFAEIQNQGRGRGSNAWLSRPGAGLTLSTGWHFEGMPSGFPALSLATGVVVAEALGKSGPGSIQLKWPNDLVHNGAKLGGILIESRGQHAGAIDVVIGVGINLTGATALAPDISQPVTDLETVHGQRPGRNRVAALVTDAILGLLENYTRTGFANYRERWRGLDVTLGREATLIRPDGRVEGIVADIDPDGGLIMLVEGSPRLYSGGELSLRVRH